ncbi:MAG: endopeptidase La [Candidatus Schekmanbacteria bacterium RIFCSPHIGHO2_02_FULL_38_11]|uniref:Lon protease n=1 Tax=Candidatus Schekmanbacteria bacterium RIFCSPLOWO2_12_FULL_38_15 TaxID=1817883 RepID=A0A1F7SL50_9BACT|nr:MAG: endopeptidase La [Candidatus Schekmanbacteria bacterium GWA2_38_9]OGL48020.1 MAG: endopeptidase La [Candidatus Schekmanbacteria bacterium RIFCSPLOWO2_02_FULL_38_14]OGL54495.1 MAG: endopeptidase La [Candidatus Schekmanbacteria bacterium RIFCSPLOWO2_12_FULL_38_15]OGL55695.1 MAG: endopeptidase La [Candidatus Schekmanbacteria bacterium RIFCSPHIGHO2_02_FULL_38_11]
MVFFDKSEREEINQDKKEENEKIPKDLPILPLKDMIVFPSTVTPLVVAGENSIKLIDDSLAEDKMVGLFLEKNPNREKGEKPELNEVGTVAVILKMLKFPDKTIRILVQGLKRIGIIESTQYTPYFKGKIKTVDDVFETSKEMDALKAALVNNFSNLISKIPYLPEELQIMVMNIEDPGRIADLVASSLNITLEEKQEILDTLDVKIRVEKVIAIVQKNLELLELGTKIQSEVQSELNKGQREYFLRQQLKAIQKELGEKDERSSEIEELEKKIAEAKMPETAEKEAKREIDRLKVIPIESAEHTVVRTYLDWLVALPWAVSTEDNLDILRAKIILDDDHYDLEKVKDRILEYLAVRKLKKDAKGSILCFAGPPGTGKTSLGKSIARALGRKFIRLSLGGVRDEAEIRGHRRTYIGALPGRIIQGVKTAGSNNPVFMLDEVDKIGMDFRGDPSSALLEVLDPEQNFSFSDHYLDVPFDLSKVMFITTANLLDPIPPALMDRMEVLELLGYMEDEKLHIAKKHLIPKQLFENGLTDDNLLIHDEAIVSIVRDYTREAGLRNLEREIANICRKVAKGITEGKEGKFEVTKDSIKEFLGNKKYFSEIAERTDEPGVAIGLAWTPSGGDILFIESTKMKGSKGLTLTGHLGDVMKESAQAALSYLRSRAKQFGIDEKFFNSSDIHIHVPAGAIPKDGPSAGITMATSLASLLTGRPVKNELAMTGEITLRGKVLPVGGIKEKVMAANRAGINTVILPKRNENDLEDIPKNVREKMKFIFVENVGEVFEIALDKRKAREDKVKPSKRERPV